MAPLSTNYAEIQHDEIEALRSIYMEDFQEEAATVGAWNVSPDAPFIFLLVYFQALLKVVAWLDTTLALKYWSPSVDN